MGGWREPGDVGAGRTAKRAAVSGVALMLSRPGVRDACFSSSWNSYFSPGAAAIPPPAVEGLGLGGRGRERGEGQLGRGGGERGAPVFERSSSMPCGSSGALGPNCSTSRGSAGCRCASACTPPERSSSRVV